MILIGIDYGDVRTGIAFSPDGKCSVPYKTVDSSGGRKKTANAIASIVAEKKADTVVIGYPLNMDGSKGRRVTVTEKFAAALKESLSALDFCAGIVFQDERLTSIEAESMLRDKGRTGHEKGISDQLSANLILQDYIDSVRKHEHERILTNGQ